MARDPDEAVAPFAPQAFYPYFWKFTDNNTINDDNWKAWFDRSIEILKVCDAVYIYTAEGLPPSEDESSKGVLEVDETARKLGLEIQYRKELVLPEDEARRAKEGAEKATSELEKVIDNVAAAEKAASFLQRTADSTKAQFGEGQMTYDAQKLADEAEQKVRILTADEAMARSAAEAKMEELKKNTWDPAVPAF